MRTIDNDNNGLTAENLKRLTFLFSKSWQVIMNRLTPEQRFQIVGIYFAKINLLAKFLENVVHFMYCLNVGGVIGPYFFRNEEVTTVTVNGKRYRAMLIEFLFPKINQLNIDYIWI